jgi:CheY-specific phosphatase CheX
MAVKFFGQYLVEQRVVSADQIRRAIELQDKRNLKFGDMAVQMGFITPRQIETAHRAQRSEDLPLGDMLVKLGFLTSFQREAVIARQKSQHLYIGEALVELGAITHDKLEHHLNEFKLDQAAFVTDDIEMPAEVPHADFCRFCADIAYKLLTRMAGIRHRPLPAQVVDALEGNDVVVSMNMLGTVNAMFIVSVSRDIMLTIAKSVLEVEDATPEPEEVLVDTVKEFANVVLGNVVAKSQVKGYKIEIVPPELIEAGDGLIAVPEEMVGVYFPVVVPDGSRCEFALFVAP